MRRVVRVIEQLFFIFMKRVAFHTLGCKLNYAETSTITRQFRDQGYEVVDIDGEADVCVINTCSVTERADRECRQIIRRTRRHSPDAFVIITGCYAQLQPAVIASLPGVDAVIGSREKFEIFRHLSDFQRKSETAIHVSALEGVEEFHIASSIDHSDRTRSFLKIQDGCDYSCAFCTIPLARGGSRSTSIEEVVKQTAEIVEAGYKEIVLTGVNVGDFGKAHSTNLLALLKALVNVPKLHRIRISSIEPNLLSDELLDFWVSQEKLCKHFHIPLQAGTDKLLKAMRRRYLTDWYEGRVLRIKEQYPRAGIGVDVIAGLPGESVNDFEDTYQFLVNMPISYLHVFTYSERPETEALRILEKVEPRIRQERSERLRILSAKKRRSFYESFLGSAVEVLFEAEHQKGIVSGFSSEYVRVGVQAPKELVNQIAKVTIDTIVEDLCQGVIERALPNDHQTTVNQEAA
ncbi:MAG: tRNA (N(6)-L-threonylcarbamoyladenosine(37)-C(2))-methylthiotransferase MtaB [bacterium]